MALTDIEARAIGQLVAAVGVSEHLTPEQCAACIRSPRGKLTHHLRAATTRGTHVGAIGRAMAKLSAQALPLQLTLLEEGMAWAGYYASGHAAVMGSKSSPAKISAARANGAKGGRPRKIDE